MRKTRKEIRKKQGKNYTIWDLIVDVLFWIPELIIWPFRLLFYLVRGLLRVIGDFLNI
ncbi:hypothetical protein [Bacillus oleivorans]|uniref:hypothetical protein n=1 Tax=Bacillus oleivorans TaxID=1448271 RepID=UPI0015CE540B|nr:hypothetical protein [Bacillus oleivorans]